LSASTAFVFFDPSPDAENALDAQEREYKVLEAKPLSENSVNKLG